jgi:hypothetical protein
MEKNTAVIVTVVILLVVVAVAVAVAVVYQNQYTTVATDASSARAAAARVAVGPQWTIRPYLHATLVSAALQRQPAAVTAALERLEHQADHLASLYKDTGHPDADADALARGLKAFDQALLETAQHHAVGDTPSYQAALAAGAAAHALATPSPKALQALTDYQDALTAHVRAAARGAHGLAHVELDKAVVASQAVGQAL